MSSNDKNTSRQEGDREARRVVIGTAVIALLGTVFGMLQIVGGSFVAWRSDSVLGLYIESGWNFNNLVAGDGKISVVLGTVGFVAIVLGAALHRKAFFAVTFACSLVVFAISIYELVFLFTRSGVVSPGAGVYMLIAGSLVGILAGIGGYFMLSESGSVTA